eukprot:s253_g28.t1
MAVEAISREKEEAERQRLEREQAENEVKQEAERRLRQEEAEEKRNAAERKELEEKQRRAQEEEQIERRTRELGEQRRREEEERRRVAEEERRLDEELRRAEEEASRLEEQRLREAEERRKRLEVESRRLEAERRQQEEQKKKEAEKARARQEELRRLEEQRRAFERAEEDRLKAEAKRQKEAEEAKQRAEEEERKEEEMISGNGSGPNWLGRRGDVWQKKRWQSVPVSQLRVTKYPLFFFFFRDVLSPVPVTMLPMDHRLNLLELEVQSLRANQLALASSSPRWAPPLPPMGQMTMHSMTPRLIPMPPQHQNKPSFIHPMGPPKVSQLDVFEMEEEEFKELEMLHRELVDSHNELRNEHAHLLKAHEDLIMAMRANATNGSGKNLKRHPALGVVRLDYEYPPAPGDSDHPGSFGYDVYYRCVPGLTFEMCQSGQFTELVERRFADAIKHLEARGASAITGDCGFMMAFQVLARKIASKPIFMSSMVQCPIIAASLDPDDDILILTANSESLKPQKEILLTSCGFDVSKERFHIHGCQDVPGFEAVSLGQKGPDGRFMSTISLASNFVSCHEWAQSGKVF